MKSSVFVGVGRGCFLEEEDSAALLSNLSSFWMMGAILTCRDSRADCWLFSLVGKESNLSSEASNCS